MVTSSMYVGSEGKALKFMVCYENMSHDDIKQSFNHSYITDLYWRSAMVANHYIPEYSKNYA